MKGLTEKQKKILDFIENFSEKEGMAPTVYEIADHFDIKTSTVFAHIRALQRKNELTRSSKARSIALTRRKAKHMSFVLPIPLLGRINAGLPVDSQEYKESDLYIDPQLLGGPTEEGKIYALRIGGESMRDLGIFDTDVVILKQQDDYQPGDIVAAMIDDETTVKSYYPMKGGRIELRPANPEFTPQVYPCAKVKILGKVVALQRKYR